MDGETDKVLNGSTRIPFDPSNVSPDPRHTFRHLQSFVRG